MKLSTAFLALVTVALVTTTACREEEPTIECDLDQSSLTADELIAAVVNWGGDYTFDPHRFDREAANSEVYIFGDGRAYCLSDHGPSTRAFTTATLSPEQVLQIGCLAQAAGGLATLDGQSFSGCDEDVHCPRAALYLSFEGESARLTASGTFIGNGDAPGAPEAIQEIVNTIGELACSGQEEHVPETIDLGFYSDDNCGRHCSDETTVEWPFPERPLVRGEAQCERTLVPIEGDEALSVRETVRGVPEEGCFSYEGERFYVYILDRIDDEETLPEL